MKESFNIFAIIFTFIWVIYLAFTLSKSLVRWYYSTFWPSPFEALDAESYTHALRGSAALVADHIIASFKEGMVVAKYGTLGKALLYHWHHACKHHPERVKCLDSKSMHFLERDPAMFYVSVGCKAHFIQIFMYLK